MFGHAIKDFLADVVGAEDEEVGAEGGEFAEEFVVLDAVDAEEAAAREGRVLAAEGLFLLAADVALRLVEGLGEDVVLRAVADPEDDGLQWAVVVEGDADDVLEALVEVAVVGTVGAAGQRLDALDAVEGQVEELAVSVGGADEVPAAVVLAELVGVHHHAAVLVGHVEDMIVHVDDRPVGDVGEDLAQQGAVAQRVLGEGDDLARRLDVESGTQGLQTAESGQPVELAEQLHGLAQELLLVLGHLLLVDGEGAVAIAVAGLLHRLVGVGLTDIGVLVYFDVGQERLALNVLQVTLYGADADGGLVQLLQRLVDQAAQVLGGVIGVSSGKELVKYLVSCLGVFVCWHDGNVLMRECVIALVFFFSAAKVRWIGEVYLRAKIQTFFDMAKNALLVRGRGGFLTLIVV